VDRAGHQLLAGAGLPADQHRGRTLGDPHHLLGQLPHLGVLADDELALRLGLQLPQHQRVAVLELLGALALGQEIPHELRARAAHHLRARGLEAQDGLLHVRVPGDVDDEIERRLRDHLAQVGAHRDVEPAGQLEAGSPGVHVDHPHDGHGRVAAEHLEQGAPALARPDDDDPGHLPG
jgi:hypothetical protein